VIAGAVVLLVAVTIDGSSGTLTQIGYDAFDMSTSIRISEETKRKLETVKRPEETFDELLARLAIDRSEADVERLAGFAEDGVEEHMRRARSDLRERPDWTNAQLDQA
jgi:predicted CopG family antitoxin